MPTDGEMDRDDGVARGWQGEAAAHLAEIFRRDAGARALVWYGSWAMGTADDWSDIDALVVLDEEAIARYHPGREWLGFLGEPVAARSYGNGWVWVHRTVFTGFRRADVVMTTEANLERVGEWPFLGFARSERRRVEFSRSSVVDRVLTGDLAPPRAHYGSDGDLRRMAERVVFGAVLAIERAVRGDGLIAGERALEIARETLLLAIVLRDREAGTTHHPHGGAGDAEVLTSLPPVRVGVEALDSVEAGLARFERMMLLADPGYVPKGPALAGAFAAARDLLVERGRAEAGSR